MREGEETLESMSQAVWYNEWTLAKLVPFIKGDILEVGCGIGNFTQQLSKYGCVWAIDIEDDYTSVLKKKLKDLVKVGFGDIEKDQYFFKNQKFDTIICLNVLEHIKDDTKALENMMGLLKEEGYLLLLVPSGMNFYGQIDRSIGHFRRYEKQELEKYLRKLGLKVKVARRLNFLGALGWWISGRLFKTKTVKRNQLMLFNFVAPIVLPLEDLVEPPFGTSILTISQK